MSHKNLWIIFALIFFCFISKEVNAQTLTITSISPNVGINKGTINVTIVGSNFQQGATVILTKAGTSIIGTPTTIQSTTIITTIFDIKDAQIGSWSVVVTNPDGRSGTLTDGFKIIPQLLINEVYYDTSVVGHEFIEIYNLYSSLINFSDFKVGDEEIQGGGEGMYEFPTGTVLSALGTITIARKAVDFKVLFGKNPDFEFVDSDPAVPNMIKYLSWGTGFLSLSDNGDEVLLLNESDTPIDVVTYENGSYTGVTPHPGVSTGNSIQRQPPNQDTDDCSVDFIGSTPTPTVLRNIIVSPTSGTVGSFVTVTGCGFFANEEISIDFGTTFTITTVTTDAAGLFSAIFTVDIQPYSTITISATGKISNAKAITKFNIINISPTITITHPYSPGAQADTSYSIGWQDEDADNNATITLYYDTDNIGTDGTQIVTNISEDNEDDYYDWDTSVFPQGASYYIYAKIDDGINPPVYNYSSGPVIIDHRQYDGKTIPWRADGIWLIGDIHMHTIASDGSYPAGTVAQYATNYGADFIAITDHADKINLYTYHTPIVNARGLFKDLVIFEGVEWNVPGAGSGGHATVFVTNSPLEHKIISSFTTTYDETGTNSDAVAALQWLETCMINDVIPICSLNHPSRPTDVNPKGFRLDQLRMYDDAGGVCIGFSGDVGHKRNSDVISHAQLGGGFHDPKTAFIGDDWDTLLDEGRSWWIRFECDFHNTSLDYYPLEFSQTRVYCPSKTYEGVIKGLRAGCIYTVHNNIITDLEFLGIAGTQTAMMGEIIQVTQGSIVTASIRVRPSAGTTIDKIELISNVTGTPSSTKIFSSSDWVVNGDWLEMSYVFTNVQDDFYFRVRGSSSATPVNLWFYSNPIRVRVTPLPELIFTKKVDSIGTISTGATLTYTLYYENAGLGTATNVILTDVIPAGTVYITGSAAGANTIISYSHDGGITFDTSQNHPVTHIRWKITTDIAPGEGGNVSFEVRIE